MTADARRQAVDAARTFLFVPGDRPERFPKADASGADVTILDLEDAVAPRDKESALAHVLDWARERERCMVRVNGIATPWIAREIEVLAGTGIAVMLPKAENVDDVRRVATALPGSTLVALVETPHGVAAAETIARSGVVARMALGNVDLAAALGVEPSSPAALSGARWSMVLASALAGIAPPVDGVTTVLDDPPALDREAGHARELGFSGKLCIHPRQVAAVNAMMSPSVAELEWARRVLAVGQEGGVGVVDGAMVDAPVLARARRLIDRADRS